MPKPVPKSRLSLSVISNLARLSPRHQTSAVADDYFAPVAVPFATIVAVIITTVIITLVIIVAGTIVAVVTVLVFTAATIVELESEQSSALEEVTRRTNNHVTFVLLTEVIAAMNPMPAGATSNFQLNSGSL
jgi:hypothetical protein